MALDTDRTARMHDMLARLRRDHPTAGEDFYHILFRRAPHLRTLFREEDMAGQGMKFMTTLAVLVDKADRPEEMGAEVRELGKGHAAYGVRAEHYEPMREALIETMRRKLGTEFDAALEAEWRVLYDRVAQDMIQASKSG
jgi:nitric oxide dioxygenase